MNNEQELRRELLLIALERCENASKALELAIQMEGFVRNGPGIDVAADAALHAADADPHVVGQAAHRLDGDPCQDVSGAPDPTPCRTPCRTPEPGKRRRWTPEEDGRLRQLWADGLVTDKIAERLHRTRAGISNRIIFLELDRRKSRQPKGRASRQAPASEVEAKPRPDTKAPAAPTANGNSASRKPRDKSARNGASDIARVVEAHTRPMAAPRAAPRAAVDPCRDHLAASEASIDDVVHFLRSRDYSIIETQDGSYLVDERETLTGEELVARANRVRVHLGQPEFANVYRDAC